MIVEATDKDLRTISVMGGSFINDSVSSKYICFNADRFYKVLNELTKSGGLKVWVAKEDGLIVGAVGLLITPNVYDYKQMLADIYFIDVIPKFRNKGIASGFMDVCEWYCSKNKITALTVSFKNQKIADNIARKRGYQKIEYKLIKEVSRWQ